MTAALQKQSEAASVEERTRAFYDNEGWVAGADGVIGENRYFRHDATARGDYAAKVQAKAAQFFDGCRGNVLFAGPGDLPGNHMAVAARFAKVTCVDISEKSLAICADKLGAKAERHKASLLDLPLADNSVDAALCAHVLFHIDAREQARCVSELLRVVRPGGRIIIIYGNPEAPLMRIQRFLKSLGVNKLLKADQLYYFNHKLSWWDQFADRATLTRLPYDMMSHRQERALFPVAPLRRAVLRWAGRFEDRAPARAAALWSYVAIRLDVNQVA